MSAIKQYPGAGPVVLSLFIPGLGQMAKGQVIAGAIWLIIAIAIGTPTCWAGAVVLGIFSAIDAANPVFKCPHCKETIARNASICKHCQSKI